MDTPHPLDTGNSLAAATATSPAIRTPDQRVRVFVSSTLDELAAERAAAREAITQLRLTPVLFESGARPYPPRELYRAYLAQSISSWASTGSATAGSRPRCRCPAWGTSTSSRGRNPS